MKNTLFTSIFVILTCMINISYAEIPPAASASLILKGQNDIKSNCIKKILNESNFADTFNKFLQDNPTDTPIAVYKENQKFLNLILQNNVLQHCIKDLDRMSSSGGAYFNFPVIKASDGKWIALKPKDFIDTETNTAKDAKEIKAIRIPLDTILEKTPANVALVIAPYYSDLEPGKYLTREQAIALYSPDCAVSHVLTDHTVHEMNTSSVTSTVIHQMLSKILSDSKYRYYSILGSNIGFPGVIFAYYYTTSNEYKINIPSYLSLSGVKYMKDHWVTELYNTACSKILWPQDTQVAAYIVALADAPDHGLLENSGYQTSITGTKKIGKDYYDAGWGELDFKGDMTKFFGFALNWMAGDAITYTYKIPDKNKGIPYLKNLDKVFILGGPYKLSQ